PYTYTSVGNVLSSTRTSLTAGTTYYFVIRVADALGYFIATSTESSAVPTAPSSGGGGGSSGGGGGGATTPSYGTGVATFSGRVYPRSLVTFLKDAQLVTTTTAGADGAFYTSASNLSAGTYIFSVYSEDKEGRRSNLVTFPTSISAGITTNITGIFIAPTIATDKSEVRRGDDIVIFGQSAPQADIVIAVNSDEEFFAKTVSDKDGIYLHNFDTALLEYGSHSAKSKAAIGNQLISGYGLTANFRVGIQNIFAEIKKRVCSIRGDVNLDCRVNLVDFSITAYWYNRPSPPRTADINGDGKVNLVDFSIMAFNWTG
ncbi:MAG: dockerin type I repeat-containing protein, partial [Patescibacteria group bacterium]